MFICTLFLFLYIVFHSDKHWSWWLFWYGIVFPFSASFQCKITEPVLEFSRWEDWENQMLTICWSRTGRPCPELLFSQAPGTSRQPAPAVGLRGLLRRKCSISTWLRGFSICSCQNQRCFWRRWKAGTVGQERHTEVSPMQELVPTSTSGPVTRMCVGICLCCSKLVILSAEAKWLKQISL